MKDGYLTVSEAADRLGVSVRTLQRYLATGIIKGEQNTPTGPWRIKEENVERAIKRRAKGEYLG